MTDARTLAYINMYAVLGTLENLCELDNKAKEIISTLEKPVSLAFDVKDVTVGFVGDLAQSIYSFQGADYTMLESAMFESKEQIQYVIDGKYGYYTDLASLRTCNYLNDYLEEIFETLK